MTTKELIQDEIERLSEQELDQLYKLVKDFTQPKQSEKQSLMSRLRSIRIDAPEDFSTNFDLYVTGEKQAANIPPDDHATRMLDELVATIDFPVTRSRLGVIAVKFMLDCISTGLLSVQDLSNEYLKNYNSTGLIDRLRNQSSPLSLADTLRMAEYCKEKGITPEQALPELLHLSLLLQERCRYQYEVGDRKATDIEEFGKKAG
jgi:hypothetical protein